MVISRTRLPAFACILVLCACGAGPDFVDPTATHPLLQNPPGTPFAVPPEPAASDPIGPARATPPPGFPIMDDAEAALLDPDDPGMMGHWYVPLAGHEVYAFYESGLPLAGFRVIGLYPGDIGAIIRFDDGTRILQVYMTGDLEQTDLILRTDQP